MTLEAFLLQMARNGVESHLPKGTVRFEGKRCGKSSCRRPKARRFPPPSTWIRSFGIRISQVILSYEDLNDFLFRVAVEDCVSNSVYRAARKKDAPATSFERLDASAVEPRFQGKILALTMGTFLPFSEFDGLAPGGPSRLDGRSARDSETIASVREILAGRRL
ncbi:hypothetical protein ACVINW_003983 [Bradyrhizobium sp. USDA 4461]